MSKLLLDDQPLVILPQLAKIIGLNESIVLQQLHYWLQKSNNIIDGVPWVYNTYEDWLEQFEFWSLSTIRRILTTLKNEGLIKTANYNQRKFDKTIWYTIDENALAKKQLEMQGVNSPCVQNEQTRSSEWTEELSNLDTPIPETTTETTTDIITTGGSERAVISEQTDYQDLAKVMTVYQNNIHPITGGIEADNLTDLVATYSAKWVEAAIGESVKNSVRKLSYIIAILERWKTNGIDEPWLKKKDGKSKPLENSQPSAQIAWEEVYSKLIVNKQKGVQWSSDLIAQAVKRVGYMVLIQHGESCMPAFIREYNEVTRSG